MIRDARPICDRLNRQSFLTPRAQPVTIPVRGNTVDRELRCVFTPRRAATNADVRGEVAAGRFRQDLLFRLNTVEIHLPPVRERREDIPLLAAHFLRQHAQRYRKNVGGLEAGAVQLLQEHGWPGNVRELDHAVERAVLMAQGHLVKASDLGLRIGRDTAPRIEDMSLEEVERYLIRKTLARCDGNAMKAAEALGLSRSAFYRRLEKHGL